MKHFLLLLTVSLTLLFTKSSGQCRVDSKYVPGKGTRYTGARELVFQIEDPKGGLRLLHASVTCMKFDIELHPGDEKMKFSWILWIYSGAGKDAPALTPGKVTIEFSDNSKLELSAKPIDAPRETPGIAAYMSLIVLDAGQVEKLMASDIVRLTVVDIGTKAQIVGHPYEAVLRELVHCVATQAGYGASPKRLPRFRSGETD